MTTDNSKLEAVLDDLAAYLALSTGKRGGGEISASYFSGIEVFIPGMVEVVQAKHANKPVIPQDVSLGDVRDFDISLMMQTASTPNGLFALERFQRVGPSDVRGRITSISPYMIEAGNAILYRDGRLITSVRTFWGSSNGRSGWRCIGPHNVADHRRPMDEETGGNLRVALGVHFLRDYDWNVHLGYPGYPSLNFPTDPTGVLEVFRLRDIPEGHTRRSALLHWVKDHWRKNRSDDQALIRVREHLRGQRTFTWNNLRCVIKPSPFDMRRAVQP